MTDWDISDYEGEGDRVNFDQNASDNDSWSDDERQNQLFDPTEITESIPLLPFDNQVGGNNHFLLYLLLLLIAYFRQTPTTHFPMLTSYCRPRVHFSIF